MQCPTCHGNGSIKCDSCNGKGCGDCKSTDHVPYLRRHRRHPPRLIRSRSLPHINHQTSIQNRLKQEPGETSARRAGIPSSVSSRVCKSRPIPLLQSHQTRTPAAHTWTFDRDGMPIRHVMSTIAPIPHSRQSPRYRRLAAPLFRVLVIGRALLLHAGIAICWIFGVGGGIAMCRVAAPLICL
ncbi:hypothetical protein CC80DRAFT_231887 [Byssothecium circinans]|uniref:Uncharacterized protein n=1 Tax=Byssothecium circinans TaxID=147558 RepID=A0A6A5UB46_9PLEO|nr:hypothetical protein CC80DRAFT_231887 [Byssothecium circinans]